MNIVIYTKSNCPNCVSAKNLLKAEGLTYTEHNLDSELARDGFMLLHPDARQMPQVFINNQRVGGLAGLQALLRQLSDARTLSSYPAGLREKDTK